MPLSFVSGGKQGHDGGSLASPGPIAIKAEPFGRSRETQTRVSTAREHVVKHTGKLIDVLTLA